ncbi:DUF5667 domain-containing protein [Amycolatopsis sp. NBC_00355]|uniref:DUF5667 domain-containing protein n=1 Tax=Amycolatopsis sp. NBC_00355 TaxID=2975957 RepID=UPI002E26C12B
MRFARERTEIDRFARALEPSPVRRDGEFADELALVGALRELGDAGSPDLETRQRIRAEIAGRLETAAATPVRRWRPRTADLVAAALFLFLVLSGLTLVLSRTALPGDALYAVKRAGETTSLNLTFGDQEKAQKHLEFATNRVTELSELAAEGASEADYRTAYDDFATDLRAGVTQLTAVATSDGTGAQQLSDVRLWARNQAARLATQQTALPADAASVFGDVRTLLGKVQERTSGLVARLNCYQITTGTADDLGLLPATGECTQRPAPSSGGEVSSAPTSPTAAESTTPAPTGTQLPPADATATAETPAPTGGITPPPVYGGPTTTPRPPSTSTSNPPPLVSIPPLLPGLPPIIIG